MTREGPQFEGLNLVARDIDATIAFYRHLGIDIPDDKIWRTDTGAHHVEGVPVGARAAIEIDSRRLAGVYNQGFDPASGTVLGFRVGARQAVDDLYEKLINSGYESRQPPYDAFWGARYAIVADPDGRDVGFMSPSEATFRSAPPDI